MYIRMQDNESLLIRMIPGPDGAPAEVVLANLGTDPEINLFLAAEQGRRKQPELWDGVDDFHLLQALENFKRRIGNQKPALVSIQGRAPQRRAEKSSESDE